MNPNIGGGFSPEGFFRQADTGKGGGVGSGKDDDPVAKKPDQEPDQDPVTKKPDQEPLDIFGELRNNLKKIDSYIRDYNPKEATELVKQSRVLIDNYYLKFSGVEQSQLLFFIDRLEVKAKALHLDGEEGEGGKKLDVGVVKQDEISLVKKERSAEDTIETEGTKKDDKKADGVEENDIKNVRDDVDQPVKKHLNLMRADAAEENESGPPPWQKDFDRLWDELQDTYRKTASTSPEIMELTRELTKITVKENFSPEEKIAYGRALLMRDVANPNAVFRHLCAENFKEIRNEPYLNEAHELRKYMELTDVFGVSIKEIVDFIENDAFNNIKHKITKEDGSEAFFSWDYAANGDPEQEMIAKGALTFQELIENKFPKLKEIPKFVSDSLITFVIVSELRYHKFYPYYNYYQNSPINGMNAEALLPWGIPGYLGYKAASITKIPSYSSVLMLTRHPSNTDLFEQQDLGYKEITFNKNWAGNRFNQKEYVESRANTFEDDLMSKGSSKRSRFEDALENRKTMIEVRNALCWMFSPDHEFGYVDLHPDMQLLPSTWDVIKGEWRGEKIQITLDDLFEIYEQFDKFVKEIDSAPKIDSSMQAMTYLSDLISSTSRYKVIFTKLGIDKDPPNPAFKELKELVELMYMFYLKKLFDQYIKLPRMKGLSYAFTPKHMQFAKEVIAEVESDKTLPGFIRGFITKAMKEIDIIPNGKWGIIFSPPTVEDPTPLPIKLQQKFGTEEAKTRNRWLKPARPEEKDPNK